MEKPVVRNTWICNISDCKFGAEVQGSASNFCVDSNLHLIFFQWKNLWSQNSPILTHTLLHCKFCRLLSSQLSAVTCLFSYSYILEGILQALQSNLKQKLQMPLRVQMLLSLFISRDERTEPPELWFDPNFQTSSD